MGADVNEVTDVTADKCDRQKHDQIVMTRNCIVLLIASAFLDVCCVLFVLLLFNRVDKYLTEPPAPVLKAIADVQVDMEQINGRVQTLTFDVRDLQGGLRDFQVGVLQRQLDTMGTDIRKLRESLGAPDDPEEEP